MQLPHDPLWPRAGDWPSPVVGQRADIALVGIPDLPHLTLADECSAHAGRDPREALRRYSLETRLRVVDAGDAPDPDLVDSTPLIAALDAQVVIALGGDNAATVPVALGRWGSAIGSAGLVTVDAHHDLRDGVSNGSPVRQLLEAGLSGARVTQVGIEPLANSAAYRQRADDAGITVVLREDLNHRDISDVMVEAIDRAAAAGGPVHVDLDLDVCDRAVAPGCPASVPGGITAAQLRAAARAAGGHPAVTSIDLAEVDAAADTPDNRTVRLAALCVLEIIRAVAER